MFPGLLFMLPVVVVDVTGDRLDPAHTRSLVAKELEIEAVAADDPRAADATGRVEIVTKDGKLTVRYRKVDGPIQRTIPVATDTARAETDAAFLAGNLARDEASELERAPARPRVETEKPSPSSAEAGDASRLAVMRGVLTQLSGEEQSGRVRGGVVALGMGAALLGAGVYTFARDGADEPKTFGLAATCTGMGAALVIVGTIVLASKSSTYEPFVKKLREEEANGAPAAEVVDRVEKEWAKAVEVEKSSRVSLAVVNIVAGGLLVASAGYFAATSDADTITPFSTGLLGVVNVALGIGTLLTEGQLEASYRMWRTVKATPDRQPTASFGAAPLPGGAAGSITVTF